MVGSAKVTVFGNRTCAYCGAARMLLKKKSVPFEDVIITDSEDARGQMEARSNSTSVPQIFIGETHVGGFEQLSALDKSGELDKLLAG